jgi:predicted site-specific integrase-resolvase
MKSPTIEELGLMSIQEKAKLDAANVAIKERDSETKFVETMAKIQLEGLELDQKAAQQDAETARELVRDMTSIADTFERVNKNNKET